MTARASTALRALLLGAALVAVDAQCGEPAPAGTNAPAVRDAPVEVRNGRDIYARFREGLADPSCDADASTRWQRHFANAPRRLASRDSVALPLFGYVVDALREADLPTEYALIPFVESGYRPGARSPSGPAGLWQFIALTARNHDVPVRPGYDGRLSPVDSTRAAVRYLKTLHGMFAGDWRLAVMAYNAGEYRVLGALRRSGQQAAHADPDKLVGLSGITHAYVRKLHALSCVLDKADDRKDWLHALDRPVKVLAPVTLPAGTTSLDAWARHRGLDPSRLKRLNPVFPDGRIARNRGDARVLAPVHRADNGVPSSSAVADAAPTAAPTDDAPVTTLADASDAIATHPAPQATAESGRAAVAPRTHTVERGDSVWRLARRYGIARKDLLERNDLTASSVLQPGMVLKLDPPAD